MPSSLWLALCCCSLPPTWLFLTGQGVGSGLRGFLKGNPAFTKEVHGKAGGRERKGHSPISSYLLGQGGRVYLGGKEDFPSLLGETLGLCETHFWERQYCLQ